MAEIAIIGIVKRINTKKDINGFSYLEVICGNKDTETPIRVGYGNAKAFVLRAFFDNPDNYREKVFKFNVESEEISIANKTVKRIRYFLLSLEELPHVIYEEYTKDFDLDYSGIVENYDFLVNQISEAEIKAMVLYLTKNQVFFTIPAGLRVHHAYKFGLLEHSVNVAKISYEMSKIYSLANKDYLIAGGLLHDVGKVECYKIKDNLPEITLASNIADHIAIGYGMVRDYMLRKGIREVVRENLLHIILSHHGTRTAGSAVTPCTIEAIIISNADNLDAKMNIATNKIKSFSDTQVCADYDKNLQCQIWNGKLYTPVSETYTNFRH